MVSGATILARVNFLRSLVQLEYANPFAGFTPPTSEEIPGWTFGMRSTAQSVETYVQTTEVGKGQAAKTMGPPAFKIADSEAATGEVHVDGETIFLTQVTGEIVTQPKTLPVNAAELVLSATIKNFSLSDGALLTTAYQHTNSNIFLGQPPGFIRLTDYSFDPIQVDQQSGQDVAGLSYAVRLLFFWSKFRQQPSKEVVTWTDERGGLYVVKQTNGDILTHELDVWHTFDHNTLLGMAQA